MITLDLDYQPGWTLAGGGIADPEVYHRKQKDLIPRDLKFNQVKWFQSKCKSFDPENNCVHLDNGKKVYTSFKYNNRS